MGSALIRYQFVMDLQIVQITQMRLKVYVLQNLKRTGKISIQICLKFKNINKYICFNFNFIIYMLI